MRTLTRVGTLLLITGLSLLSVTFIRNASTGSFGLMFMTIPPKSGSTLQSSYLFPPQEIRLSITANSTIDVYLLNSEGLNLWKETSEIDAISEFKNIQQSTFHLQIEKRGEYAILVYNDSNSSTSGQINVTLSGLETDLLTFSSVVTTLGLTVLLVSLVIRKTPKTPKTTLPN